MADAAQMIDTLKLRFYNDWLYQVHMFAEGESPFHKQLTTDMVKQYVDPLNLPKDAHILDLGCGPGYFLDEMKDRGYTNVIGVTLAPEDIALCQGKGHTIKQYDISFLPQKDGYYDESVDFIFLRHALEHSPYPIFSLIEYNRLLKQGSRIYIEVPQPDCERRHEFSPNHYSVFGKNQLVALLQRTGFDIDAFNDLEFDVSSSKMVDGVSITAREKFYCIVARKARPLDIK